MYLQIRFFDPKMVTKLLCEASPRNPGREQAYHALSAGFLLGELIERVTGKDANALLDEVIRKPMGMKYFTYGLNQDTVAKHYMTGPHLPPVDWVLKQAIGGTLGEAITISNDPRFRQTIIPAGNIYATAEEASRFFQMLLNEGKWEGKQILKPETVARAKAPVKKARFDRSLMMPLQFSAGFMLGQKKLSLFGLDTPKAFGHLGFVNILCWADPERDLAGSLMTSGKGVIGPHLPSYMKLQGTINKICKV